MFVKSSVERELRFRPMSKISQKKSLLVFGMMAMIVLTMGAAYYLIPGWIGGDAGLVAGIALGGLVFYQGEEFVRKRLLGERVSLFSYKKITGIIGMLMMGFLDVATASSIMIAFWAFGLEPWPDIAWLVIIAGGNVFCLACIKEVLIEVAEKGEKVSAIGTVMA